eukprot:TRINITY_DN11536_c0_g2_i4.p1 TRINITY_DN11536_c0_g2~~TRINITY_DN11536_c0_g2_i4.p1  ORF type:complete len:147 (-),score=2.05 TRINITY_DN11536_c0_g2_i4:172-612(-)
MEFNESPINPEVQHLGKKTYQYKEKEDAEIHPHEAGFGNACDFPIKLESALKFHSALQSNNEEVNGNTDNNVTDNASSTKGFASPTKALLTDQWHSYESPSTNKDNTLIDRITLAPCRKYGTNRPDCVYFEASSFTHENITCTPFI